MIQKAILLVLSMSVLSTGFAQETARGKPCRRGEASDYGSRNATALSMMGWGLGLGVGVAALCALIPNNNGSSSHNH